jgi:hypothetical protein
MVVLCPLCLAHPLHPAGEVDLLLDDGAKADNGPRLQERDWAGGLEPHLSRSQVFPGPHRALSIMSGSFTARPHLPSDLTIL